MPSGTYCAPGTSCADQLSAASGSAPVSGSIAVPLSKVAAPATSVVPSPGRWITGVCGARLTIVIVRCACALSPPLSVTITLTR